MRPRRPLRLHHEIKPIKTETVDRPRPVCVPYVTSTSRIRRRPLVPLILVLVLVRPRRLPRLQYTPKSLKPKFLFLFWK